jgi:SAM-dependent methyltransferase
MSGSELARWNERYRAAGYIFGTAPNAFLASKAHLLHPGQTALCIADGEGRNSIWLAGQGLEVTAFDLSPVAVDKAMQLARERGVEVSFAVADVAAWPWPGERFDVVAAIFVQFAEPALRIRMFEGIVRTLKPGGLLLLQGYTPQQLDYKTGGRRRWRSSTPKRRYAGSCARSRSSSCASTWRCSRKAASIPAARR